MKCAVINCNKSNNGKASDCSFFRFPSEDKLRKKWISFSGRKKFNPSTASICMHHFKAEDFMNSLQYEMGFVTKRLLKNDAVPSIIIGNTENNDLHEERSRRCERRENKKIVDILLKNSCSADLMPSQETHILQSIENADDTGDEFIDIKIENIDEFANYHAEKPSEEIFSSDANTIQNLNLKVEALENEIIVLKKEKEINDTALRIMKDGIEDMCKIHKKEKQEMKKSLARTTYKLACIEEKLKVIFTKGQIKKLKNGMKRQRWSEDDVARSFALYSVSPKMYKLLYRSKFPLPAVRTLQVWCQKSQVTIASNDADHESLV